MPPRNSRKPASDFTGRKTENLQKEHQEELKARSKEMAMMTAEAEQAKSDEVIDLTKSPRPEPEVTEQESDVVAVEEPYVTIRVNTDLEQVTIGYGNNYDFEVGRNYRVPRHVAEHLEEKGVVYH
jgi:hypothetical protein